MTVTPLGERRCVCVHTHAPQVDPLELQRHHVWPKSKGGPDVATNLRWLCPSTHVQVHRLWRLFERYGKVPQWSLYRTFSPYTRATVADGWEQYRGVAA